MGVKIAAGLVALILVVAYLLAPVIKLKDMALGVVVLIGLVMMLVDLVQSLKSRDD